MPSAKQRTAARRNIQKAVTAKKKRTIAHLPKATRIAFLRKSRIERYFGRPSSWPGRWAQPWGICSLSLIRMADSIWAASLLPWPLRCLQFCVFCWPRRMRATSGRRGEA